MAERRQPRITLEQALEKTASASDFTATAMKRALEQTETDSPDHAAAAPCLNLTGSDSAASAELTATADVTRFIETSQVPVDLLAGDTGVPAQRFELHEEVGRGATGRVYALRDNSLDRTVAVKFLRHGRETAKRHFLHEARVTATLEHPNIMPVYDIGATHDGRLFFTMKKISGVTLGDAIRAAREGRGAPEEFRTTDGIVRIFLKVCDALTYAHHRGFVHQDVKPDNIMLGEYGEVLLLDWGSAARIAEAGSGERRLYGTPAYMSPEQARRERADQRSDVYCVGATLFHALTLRHPTWAEDPEVFWDKKRRGIVDPLRPDERRRAPKVLLDIALKALEAEPSRRYQSVMALADDLKRYQAGMAVSAHRETLAETLVRWYRRNRRLFWSAALPTAAVLAVAGLLLREKIQELVTWRPYFHESFSYRTAQELAQHWAAWSASNWSTIAAEPFSDSGSWRVQDSALHGYSFDGFRNITYRRPVPGDIRVDWTVIPQRINLNLNCFIAGEDRTKGYTFHVGGFDDPRICVLTKGEAIQRLDQVWRDQPIRVGQRYRMRMEKEGGSVRLFIDGRKVIDYHDPDPLGGVGHQTFGFENNNFNHLSIDDVSVYYHPLPLKVSPLATPNHYFERGEYREALAQYRALIEAYPEHDIAAVARYKAARCLELIDSTEAAGAAYAAFERRYPRHALAALCAVQRARVLEREGDTAQAEIVFRETAARFPRHPALRTVFFDMATDRNLRRMAMAQTWVRDSGDDGRMAQWLTRESARMRGLGLAFGVPLAGTVFLEEAGATLFYAGALGVADLALRFPEQRTMIARTLNNLGDFQAVTERYADLKDIVAEALYFMGRYREVIQRCPQSRGAVSEAMVALGHYEAVLRLMSDRRGACAEALRRSGRFDELFALYGDVAATCRSAARDLGRLREFLPSIGANELFLARTYVDVLHMPESTLAVMARYAGPQTLDHRLTVAEALRYLGRYDEVVERYGRTPDMEFTCAHALRLAGRSDEAMARYPSLAEVQTTNLLARGEFEAILARYPERVHDAVDALLCMGRYDEVLKRWPGRDSLCGAILFLQGRYGELLRRYPDLRDLCAESNLRLGRNELVVRSYPDRRKHCARALLAQGKLDEALERYPESRRECAQYLLSEGRFEDVVRRFADQPNEYGEALAALGRYGEAWPGVALPDPDAAFGHRCLAALHAWAQGRRRTADSLLARPGVFWFDWSHERFDRFLLGPVLHALAGDTAALGAACRRIRERHTYVFGQRLWYEAGLLSGAVSEEQFLAQPYGHHARRRLAFVRALRADIHGDWQSAVQDYREWLAQPLNDVRPSLQDLEHSRTVHHFVQWRLKVLSGDGATPGAGASARE